MKLLCTLERKILNMELRHQHREKELQQVPVRTQLADRNWNPEPDVTPKVKIQVF